MVPSSPQEAPGTSPDAPGRVPGGAGAAYPPHREGQEVGAAVDVDPEELEAQEREEDEEAAREAGRRRGWRLESPVERLKSLLMLKITALRPVRGRRRRGRR